MPLLETGSLMVAVEDLDPAENWPAYEAACRAVWESMSGAQRDCLRQLVTKGPIWDGDIVSKAGRGDLFTLGLATRVIVNGEQGFTGANYLGWDIYKRGIGE